MDSQPTDQGLMAAFTTHRAALARFLRARGAAADADDLLQDMWLKLRALDHGPIAEPLAYLYRMADNQLLDRYRENGRRTRRETVWGEISSGISPNAEDSLLAREGLKAVDETLGALGERTHSILYKYRVDGQSQKDIAQELGVSLSLVEKHLQRAYRALLTVKARFYGSDEAGDDSDPMPPMSDDRAQREAVTWRLRLPTMTDADWTGLTEWLEADPANARAYDAVASLDAELPAILVGEGVRGMPPAFASAPALVTDQGDRIEPPARRRGLAFALAAALVATITVGVGYRLVPVNGADQVIVTSPGERRAVRLHDGTIVELNGDGRLIVAAGADRQVTLDRGQASFRVVHDAAAPFRVRAGSAVLQDIGTTFDVTRYPGALEVAVAEGAVAYDPDRSNVVLHAGQAARVSGSPLTLEVRDVDRASVGSWRSHRLIYHAAPLDRIAVDVGRAVGESVTVDPRLAGTTFSGVLLMNGGANRIRTRIEGVLGIDVVADGKSWHFRPPTHAPQ